MVPCVGFHVIAGVKLCVVDGVNRWPGIAPVADYICLLILSAL